MRKSLPLLLLPLLALSLTALAQEENNGAAPESRRAAGKIKPYAELISSGAITQPGLYTVHQVGSKYYFEIPFDLLGREILVVTRISGFVRNLNFGGAGMKSRPQQVVRWQRHGDQALLRSVSYNSVADENLPVYQSVRNNNFEPVIMTFDIAAFNPDSSALLIEVNPLFATDVEMFGALSQAQRRNFEIKNLDAKRSFIQYTKSFPQNTEVRHVLTYVGTKLPDNALTNTLSLEMNQSFILLPAEPMRPRHHDPRVGYFSVSQIDYGRDEQRSAPRRYITRWRLEPEDPEAYARGELTAPRKPIVYYIDPATPEKWRPYIKQGVDDWQPAFEKAGFKNAIYALDPPSAEEDPDWSPEDARYSVIRYITTEIQNAQGPHVHDPRSGEILESDILWYHNVMRLLRNWFFVQTSAVNPQARRVKFDDAVMGELIRFVSAHEVGHTLGLPHNMAASAAYPVDSLRAPGFVQRMGVAASIMDYARFNYVAQPEDEGAGLYPRIGPYDEWSIIFGYRYLPGISDPDEERPILNQWVKERADDPIYRYGRQHAPVEDPSAQTEDLGDDPIYASELGLANLRRIVPRLIEWSAEEAKPYEELNELYGQVAGQFRRYIGHVAGNIGGVYERRKTADEDGLVYEPVARERQRRALRFIDEQVFRTPVWLLDNEILRRIEAAGAMERVRGLQEYALNQIFDGARLLRLSEAHALEGPTRYSPVELFEETRQSIFSELRAGAAPDHYRRSLQRAFLAKMEALLQLKESKYDHSDIKALARGALKTLREELTPARKRGRDAEARLHWDDIAERVERALKPTPASAAP